MKRRLAVSGSQLRAVLDVALLLIQALIGFTLRLPTYSIHPPNTWSRDALLLFGLPPGARYTIRVSIHAAVAVLILAWTPAYAQPECRQDAACYVTQRRAQYPTPIPPAKVVTLLRLIAADLNDAQVPGGPFGLLIKKSGSNCSGYSCDIVCSGQGEQQRQWDVLIASEAEAKPTWRELTTIAVRPCEVVATGPQPDPLPSQEIAELRTELEKLRGNFNAYVDLWLKEQERQQQAQEAHAQSLEDHRKVAREELQQAKSFFRKWIVERLLPVVGGVAAGWFSRPKDE